ncbi:MAG: DUF2892 domain-containing protein [Deltaproteobacteria bacterium]|jgi:hypothetical protein|nr:DUF2892 domain-containing protein [Deltaproteobacteria bacterium]
MKVNESSTERVVRVIAGIILLSIIFVGPQSWWGLIGLVPLITGLFGNCPLYTLLGISTCKKSVV